MVYSLASRLTNKKRFVGDIDAARVEGKEEIC